MSQIAATVARLSPKKSNQEPFGVEVSNVRPKQMTDCQQWAKKNSLPEGVPKRMQKDSLIQDLVDCLESNKLEIQKLEEIIKYKDKTIRVLQKRHFQAEKTSEQSLRLQALLREKSSTLDKVAVFLKTVSERVEAIINLNIFDQFKNDQQEQVNRTLNARPCDSDSGDAQPSDFNYYNILNDLDTLESFIGKLSSVTGFKSQTVLDLSSIDLVQMPLEQTSLHLQFELAKNTKLHTQKKQLLELLEHAETSRTELANKVETEYLRVRAQIKNKNAYSVEELDDVTSLLLKSERQEKIIQQYAVQLVKVRNSFTDEMRETLHKIWGLQKNHKEICEQKDNEIAQLKSKLQIS